MQPKLMDQRVRSVERRVNGFEQILPISQRGQ